MGCASGAPVGSLLICNPSHQLPGVIDRDTLGAARVRLLHRLAAIAPAEAMASE
jgi:hypothetical protein